ncbi:MAG: type IV pilus assembly protein PilM [Chthoniobacterales bacterium]
MPAAKRAVAVNIGMQTVTMAVFELGGDSGLVLSGVARADLLPDPAMDASRPGQLKIAIGELRAKLKTSNAACAIAIPSQGVFTRFVKIPKVDAEQAAQMLFFEAQQNVPYPIEEVAWCYQVLPEKEEDKLGAVILAAKLDQLEETVGAVREGGLSPSVIETSPTALYNSLRYNYPDLGGCVLLIDIGARATNLIFAEGDKLFIRTLPVGGNSITAALQKKFEGRALAALEEAKTREGFIAPPGSFDPQGGDSDEIGKIARTVMTRIHNEITRSITFYRTNQQGATPTQVLLAGGGAAMPYTLEFFNEKLSLPVGFFNPLRRISVATSADAEEVRACSLTLGECTGMAARMLLGSAPLEVGLESRRLQEDRREKARRPFLITTVLLLTGVLGAWFLHLKVAADRLAELNSTLGERVATLEGFKKELDQANLERSKLFQEAADLAAAPMLRTVWSRILDDISQRMPARNIWITRLRPMSEDKVLELGQRASASTEEAQVPASEEKKPPFVTALSIDGLYLENEGGPAVVDAFVDALSKSDLFNVTQENKGEVVQLRAAQGGETWAYDYKLVLPLRRPIPL